MPKTIANNTHNVGMSFRYRTTFEAFQSDTYFLSITDFFGSLFSGSPGRNDDRIASQQTPAYENHRIRRSYRLKYSNWIPFIRTNSLYPFLRGSSQADFQNCRFLSAGVSSTGCSKKYPLLTKQRSETMEYWDLSST